MLWWESCSGEEARVEKARDLPGGEPVLRARGIDKSFGAVRVLESVDFEVRPGEVVALIGDNGAGKSTLINILTGVLRPDSGEIFFEEKRVRFATPHEARERGIETVYQDLAVAPQLDAVSNIFLGREHRRAGILGRLGFLDGGRMRRETEDQLTDLRVRLSSLEKPLSTLSGGQRQGVAVARAVMWASKVVIMDEPTAALGPAETRAVEEVIGGLRDRGFAVLVISHNLEQVFRLVDRVWVLRRGRLAGQRRLAETTPEDLVAMITGASAAAGGSSGGQP